MLNVIRRSRGAALIVVLGVLAILSILATSLLVLSTTDRTVAVNYMDQVRAGRLARSGVAAVTAALAADPFDPNLRYWGNDEDQDNRQSPGESAEGAASVHDVPLDFAKNPSLAVEVDGDPDPKGGQHKPVLYTVPGPNGKPVSFGISGYHSGSTYGMKTDVYQVRVTESSGCLHLNDGATQMGGNDSSVSQNLRRMLNVLGGIPTVAVPGLGDRLMKVRPAGGFGSITELEPHFSHEELARFRPFVATHSWVDKNVANPVPLSASMSQHYPVKYYRGGDQGLFRRGHGASALGSRSFKPLTWFEGNATDKNHCAIYGLDELNPSYIEVVHRAPVNINTARREVLITLLSDLHGFFVAERRAFSPYSPSPKDATDGGVAIPQRYYAWWTVKHTYDDRGTDGDEYGFIYRTQPIAGPRGGSGTTTTWSESNGVSAEKIADHILACREKGQFEGISYGNEWFGGEFKTWNQFNRFVDFLVERGVIKDNRPIFFDNDASTWDAPELQVSKAGQKFASYAIADVLKANFNPNLHLNELNPDANLYLRVDKTDLVVNSTEFTFFPTGVYEIESIGRILKPVASGGTQTTQMHAIEAERRVSASVRVFDTYRETSQRHFLGGSVQDKESEHPTSSGMPLDFGPEPDVHGLYKDHYGGYTTKTSFDSDGYRGQPPGVTSRSTGWGYEFDGYLTLSTYGGKDRKQSSAACTPHWPTEGASEMEGMHVHFNGGFDADFNSGIERRELASGSTDSDVKARNHPDQTGDPAGPLHPGTGKDGAHRLARSFRLPSIHSTEKPPVLAPFAPGDLRTDGFYSERNSGAAYLMQQLVAAEGSVAPTGNFAFHGGVLSLWIKPSFYPEHTGKARNIVSMSRYHTKEGYRSPSPFNLMFLPAHDRPAYSDSEADEMGKWGQPGGMMGSEVDPPRPKGGPIAPKAEYRDPFSPMYDGNIDIASRNKPTELRGDSLGVWQFRPASLMGFRGATSADAGFSNGNEEGWNGNAGAIPDLVDIENYALTSCLNHNLHKHGLDTGSTPIAGADQREMRPNYIEAHRWTHVLMSWQILPPW